MVKNLKNYKLQLAKMRFYSHIIDHIYHVFALFLEYLRIPFSRYFNYLYRGTLPVLI